MRYKTYSMVSLLKDDDHSYQVTINNSEGQQVPLFTNAQFRNTVKFRGISPWQKDRANMQEARHRTDCL